MTFTAPLKDITVAQGQNVTLTCETSTPGSQVTWCKDGIEIKDTESGKYETECADEKHYLKIKDAEMEDGGKYTAYVGEEKTTAMLCVEGS